MAYSWAKKEVRPHSTRTSGSSTCTIGAAWRGAQQQVPVLVLAARGVLGDQPDAAGLVSSAPRRARKPDECSIAMRERARSHDVDPRRSRPAGRCAAPLVLDLDGAGRRTRRRRRARSAATWAVSLPGAHGRRRRRTRPARSSSGEDAGVAAAGQAGRAPVGHHHAPAVARGGQVPLRLGLVEDHDHPHPARVVLGQDRARAPGAAAPAGRGSGTTTPTAGRSRGPSSWPVRAWRQRVVRIAVPATGSRTAQQRRGDRGDDAALARAAGPTRQASSRRSAHPSGGEPHRVAGGAVAVGSSAGRVGPVRSRKPSASAGRSRPGERSSPANSASRRCRAGSATNSSYRNRCHRDAAPGRAGRRRRCARSTAARCGRGSSASCRRARRSPGGAPSWSRSTPPRARRARRGHPQVHASGSQRRQKRERAVLGRVDHQLAAGDPGGRACRRAA